MPRKWNRACNSCASYMCERADAHTSGSIASQQPIHADSYQLKPGQTLGQHVIAKGNCIITEAATRLVSLRPTSITMAQSRVRTQRAKVQLPLVVARKASYAARSRCSRHKFWPTTASPVGFCMRPASLPLGCLRAFVTEKLVSASCSRCEPHVHVDAY